MDFEIFITRLATYASNNPNKVFAARNCFKSSSSSDVHTYSALGEEVVAGRDGRLVATLCISVRDSFIL